MSLTNKLALSYDFLIVCVAIISAPVMQNLLVLNQPGKADLGIIEVIVIGLIFLFILRGVLREPAFSSLYQSALLAGLLLLFSGIANQLNWYYGHAPLESFAYLILYLVVSPIVLLVYTGFLYFFFVKKIDDNKL